MKSWTVVICLVVSQLVELGCGKRFDPAMVDPLMRRSALDKNFMRFGRSSPSFEDKDEVDEGRESPPGADTNKEDSFLRSMRGKDNNFLRFGRGKNDNFMRFGRGKQDSFIRFGRARNDNFMRFGRGRDNNFMRFGRGKQDNFMRFGRGRDDNYLRFGRGKDNNFMRFGRGRDDNYLRFGRGKDNNFMRFGRGRNDNFMRFGRGKQDNFMRFGRDFIPSDNLSSDISLEPPNTEDAALRIARGKQNNLMRFGKKSEEDTLNDLPIEIRSVNPKQNFIRFGRGKQDNFMRFGKSDDGKSSSQTNEDPDDYKDTNDNLNGLASLSGDGFPREVKSKELNLIRLGRHPINSNNAFIRFGRSSQNRLDDELQSNELIPQRLKRSVLVYDPPDESYQSEFRQDSNDHASVPFTSLPEELEEEYVAPIQHEDFNSRKKRSLAHRETTPTPIAEDTSVVDYISAKLRLRSSQPEYESSLLSAGLPNVIVGPEFSLLPDLDPPASMLKRGRPGDKSFLRLG